MDELPKYSVSYLTNDKGIDVVQAYLVMREHWELIDKVFSIESPGKPEEEDFHQLLNLLIPHCENNSFIRALTEAVDSVGLAATRTRKQVLKEISQRKKKDIAWAHLRIEAIPQDGNED